MNASRVTTNCIVFAGFISCTCALIAQESVIYSFSQQNEDAYDPAASMIVDSKGSLYGTTQQGGIYGAGAIFKLSPEESGA